MRETEVCIISPGTEIEGRLDVSEVVRFHGRLKGELRGARGSSITLTESSSVEGEIHGDTLYIEGFVEGSVSAERIVIRSNARVRGKLESKSLIMEPGAVVEAKISRVGSP